MQIDQVTRQIRASFGLWYKSATENINRALVSIIPLQTGSTTARPIHRQAHLKWSFGLPKKNAASGPGLSPNTQIKPTNPVHRAMGWCSQAIQAHDGRETPRPAAVGSRPALHAHLVRQAPAKQRGYLTTAAASLQRREQEACSCSSS